MKKLLFRADGNNITGLGHLYRVFALIEIYKSKFECTLLTKAESALQVIPSNVEFKTIPEYIDIEKEPAWLESNFSPNEFIIVTDGYHFSPQYQLTLKSLKYKLMVIDDFAKGKVYADWLVNHALSVKRTDYEGECYTRFALGSKYAILRPAFLNAAGEFRKVKSIENVFVCFGGSDQFDLSLRCAQALLQFQQIQTINVIVGAAYNGTAIFELATKETRIKIYQNIAENELLQVMNRCHLAVVSSSNILYEVFAIKMPVLSGFYVENQVNIYKGCVENHLIFEGGDFKNFSIEDFVTKISNILAVKDFDEMIHAQSLLFDAKIKERFLDLMITITYRRAVIDDLLLVFEWANDPASRVNSYSSDPIDIETHKNWFNNKLRDLNALFFIAECNGIPAGLVRYEKRGSFTIVGILVAEKFRGKGLATEFLKGTSRLYFEQHCEPVLAYIKVKNVASIRSFESALYKKISEEDIQGTASFVFKLEKNDI